MSPLSLNAAKQASTADQGVRMLSSDQAWEAV